VSSDTAAVEVELCLPLIGQDERDAIRASVADSGMTVSRTTDQLLESAGEVATLILITWAANKALDRLSALVRNRYPTAIKKIKAALPTRKPIFQLMIRSDSSWAIYTLPSTDVETALLAIPSDIERNPADGLKDHRSWEGGRWLSAHKYLHDAAYRNQVQRRGDHH